MNSKVKWLFTIANKNDVPQEIIYDYIAKHFGKDSIKKLSDTEIDDVTRYVSDSRLVKNEKQLFLIIKKAEGILVSRDHLDRLSSKFGAHNLEELDENGIRGIMSILSSLEKKFLSRLPSIEIQDNVSIFVGSKSVYCGENPIPGVWLMRPGRKGVTICPDRYIDADPTKIFKKDRERSRGVSDNSSPEAVKIGGKTACWASGRISLTMYTHNGRFVAVRISGKVILGDIYDSDSNSYSL
ncbi:MAG: hypothetical protein PHX79_06855 [Sphaerochaetaceae bacterium]|nr:hypothetical protein [Sphaerochaetaceae bacterium]